MREGTVSLTVRDEELVLHPLRAALWPRRKTVVVADSHFGKSSFFGRHGIAVPAGTDDEDRDRLTRLVKESSAERLIILGDFLHAPIAADSREARDLDAWAQALAPVHILVVAGNHDQGACRHFSSSIAWCESEWLEPPFRFIHEASSLETDERTFTVSGHVHPVMKLQAIRKQSLRIPVFWQRKAGLVLPSFGAFTGGYVVSPSAGDRLFAVGPTAVTPMGAATPVD